MSELDCRTFEISDRKIQNAILFTGKNGILLKEVMLNILLIDYTGLYKALCFLTIS